MRSVEIAVIGSGFAGLGMAAKLRAQGEEDFVVLERAPSIGGVWRDNTYPGAACDVPAPLYSYSFAPNPTWTRLFAPQAEIRAYLERCADDFGVRDRIDVDRGASDLAWDEGARRWRVATTRGEAIWAKYVVCAAGLALTTPRLPEIPGLDTFEGPLFHSARWDHGVSLRGKRVAVVGTGASAIQIVPAIVDEVGHLSVFQRTPPWVMERPEISFGPLAHAIFSRAPITQKLLRGVVYGALEGFALGFVVDPRINKARQRSALRYMRRAVPDPALRAKLTPAFTLGCKRVLFSSEYFPAIQRPNAELVTDRITRVTSREIETADGARRPVDVIVCATGFEAADAQLPFDVRGRGGASLRDLWARRGAQAYRGTTVAGFPNFFVLVGPNTLLGHSSMIYMMESQMAYVLDALAVMRARGAEAFDVRGDAQDRYNAALQARLSRSVWRTGGCASWYLGESDRITTLWPGFTFEFRRATRRFDAGAYAFDGPAQRRNTTLSTSAS